ncbi:helix-turn-helix domain-containing protein [Bacteroides salyersiae]|uniref:Helix-turn-helix domain-containing protein n=1 Tax=Bacteroides salyersiae TaxID=291644 RepID=A0A7J4XF14_9BACE|nr:helix-turn-helix domain-containing protein [Bacteroides salyersiae]KAA3694372.1 helix-turn-helix domain-containing protein [Bacteroides salyersiae]KAA3697805.1 helix-turn-helix domain-containing protein [Bacteroides salyersiae]KAA3700426.1 helix-turn-helix domain-containing protein [Bacteroides salyersiae]KAA3701711.1 helix-turn-helix domain-containing protein [Bacteroides salyersiae]KAA3707536.1 helix-turn-helix domain-containing protein [Bacteroides salyersiae]
MEIITFESKAYKELDNKITAIADYIFNHTEAESTNEDEIWVDSYEVCTFLKISDRTLQRLRAAGTVTYSNIKGHYFYKIGEIKRLLEEHLIKRDKDSINDLITNHQLYVKERRNIRKDK